MRTLFWASALAAGTLFAAAPLGKMDLPSGGSVTYSTAGSNTRFEIRTKAGQHYEVSVQRDSMVSPKAQPSKVQMLGEIPGKALILTDAYPSVALGMSLCQAGEEQFLRVITLAGGSARQTLHLKLASCRDNIELADSGLEWNPKSATLQLHWLEGPDTKGKSEERSIHIGPDGQPAETEPKL